MHSCDLPCSNNVLTTITSLVDAIWSDMLTVVRLVAACFGRLGLSGCVCQIFSALEPAWRKVSRNPKVRCEDGDPFDLLMTRIVDVISETSENLLNNHLVDPTNDFFESVQIFGNRIFGRPIPRVCFEVSYDPTKCIGGALTLEQASRLAQCEDQSYGLEEMCFWARVREICSSGDMLNEYTQIFAQGYKSVDEVQQEFADAFGESYQFIDPSVAELMRQVESSSFSGPDLSRRKDICSSNTFASAMSLDMVRTADAPSLMQLTRLARIES